MQQRGNGRKAQTTAASPQKDSWVNSGWNEEADSYLATKRRTPTFDKEVSTKKGFFLCEGNFEHSLEPNLSRTIVPGTMCLASFVIPRTVAGRGTSLSTISKQRKRRISTAMLWTTRKVSSQCQRGAKEFA